MTWNDRLTDKPARSVAVTVAVADPVCPAAGTNLGQNCASTAIPSDAKSDTVAGGGNRVGLSVVVTTFSPVPTATVSTSRKLMTTSGVVPFDPPAGTRTGSRESETNSGAVFRART
jgi:hypothetical protein